MITVETKFGPVVLDESMRGKAIMDHIPARKVESKEDWKEAKKQAEAMLKWWDENNGKFKGAWESGYALHHAQVAAHVGPDEINKPFSFFVVDKKLTRKEWAKEIAKKDRSIRDITNIIFPDQVIFNPEIITATQTFLDDTIDPRTKRRYKRGTPNVMKYDEGCMSFHEQTRSAKRVDRFYRIKVRYQIIRKRTLLPDKIETIEEWIQGLKSHIFQHEIDHSVGHDIVHGFGDKKFLTIEDRELENGYTRKEVEEFTAKRIAEIEEKVQEKGICILQSVANGRYYKVPTDLTELPDGFLEPDVIEIYDNDGNIRPPFDTVPMYTDPSAKEEMPDVGAISFDEKRPKYNKKKQYVGMQPNMTKNKVVQAIAGIDPSRLDGCYYLPDDLFYELAGELMHGTPNTVEHRDTVLSVHPEIAGLGFSVHGMVFYPISKKKN